MSGQVYTFLNKVALQKKHKAYSIYIVFSRNKSSIHS